MVFGKSLLACVALVASAIAQTNAPVAFTSVPAIVNAGSSYNISWGGGDGSPVTLTLRKGDPSDLDTIGVLADSFSGSSCTWTVSDTLQSATDYALQITQGQNSINYSGMFTITGAASNSTSSEASATVAATALSIATITTSPSAVPTGAAGNGTGIGSYATTTSSYTGRTITTTPITSAHSATAASATEAAKTSVPNPNAAVQYGSSAAFVVGVIGAVLSLN